MSNCPHCQAPIPAPKPGASRPLSFCQACGKSLPAVQGAVKSAPAKTLMWSGGPIPGLPIKPASPSSEAPPAPAPAAAAAEPPADGGKRRTSTADIGMAPTIVPPAPDSIPANLRLPQKTVIGSGLAAPIPGVAPAPAPAPVSPPTPAEVDMSDVSVDEAPATPPQNEGESPDAPASPAAGPEGSGPSAASAVPEWAASSPSVGTSAKSTAQPGRNKLLIAGVAGGGLLVVAVVAGLLAGGKSPAKKPETAIAKAVPTAEPAKPVPPPAANPMPVAAEPAKAAAEPAKAPAAEPAKAAPAPEKAAVPAEKPAAAKPVAAVVPAAEKAKPEKKPAPEKLAMAEHQAKPAPAPKAAPAPVAEKAKAWNDLAPAKAEKKAPEAAASNAGNKAKLAAEAYQRGNAKLLSGALPEAIAAFSEAIKLNPQDAQSQRGLGLAYAQSGKAPMAVRHLKLYLKTAPAAPDRALIEKRIEQLSGR
jgi:hypothetical protein